MNYRVVVFIFDDIFLIYFFFLQLCFAYKGLLRDEVGLKFGYLNSQGVNDVKTAKIYTPFTKDNKYVLRFFFLKKKTCKVWKENANLSASLPRLNVFTYTQMELQVRGHAEFAAGRIYRKHVQPARDLSVQGRVRDRFLCRRRSHRPDSNYI